MVTIKHSGWQTDNILTIGILSGKGYKDFNVANYLGSSLISSMLAILRRDIVLTGANMQTNLANWNFSHGYKCPPSADCGKMS